jgi:hypothetical protein
MQARAMALMAQKLEASLALEGQFSAEGLAAMSTDGGSLTMELAKSLVENLDFGDVDRVWGHRGAEDPKPCGGLPKVDGGFFSQRRNATKKSNSQPKICYGQRLLFMP